MESRGVRSPRLAVTELQLFAHLRSGAADQATNGLTQETLVTPATLAEALYDTLIYHAAVRLQPFVELVTHSATVNHGGGLRKEHERVYANPCYYANQLFANFAETIPVKTELQAAQERAPLILPDLKRTGAKPAFGAVDAIGAVTATGDLLVSIVHRGTLGPVHLAIQIDGFPAGAKTEISTLSGPAPWTANTLDRPQAVNIVTSESELRQGALSLTIAPYSVVQARLSAEKRRLTPDR
jgi:alpha-N-arabinofuranosidase